VTFLAVAAAVEVEEVFLLIVLVPVEVFDMFKRSYALQCSIFLRQILSPNIPFWVRNARHELFFIEMTRRRR
jgi:hypothetical protein